MSAKITLLLDGVEIEAEAGRTILQAADEAGILIPRLCHHPELETFGGCRVCTVKANGRFVASCVQPAAPGMVVQVETEELKELRKALVEMLFVTGNHYCSFCEKAGKCELQAMAARLGVDAPRHPYEYPAREVDATHPGVWLDRNRCILCGRCVRASRDLDGKTLFGFVNRGGERSIAIGANGGLGASTADAADRAFDVCPVGALLRKGTAYRDPIPMPADPPRGGDA